MAKRLREVEARMETVAFKSVSARLAASLLDLARDDGKIVGVSHQDLADIVGTYRETVTRILNEFRGEGFIELGRLNVTLLNIEDLQAVAES
ncbi:MAG: winged helix-turn-helix domain-containing protein [Chloroflexi bacterium]|nr:winged helix-turn-helix domain-containing protein [Chloroflexota bacterium]